MMKQDPKRERDSNVPRKETANEIFWGPKSYGMARSMTMTTTMSKMTVILVIRD